VTDSCSLPDPPREYDADDLIDEWLANSDAHDHAHNVDRFARYVPELGWRSILAVLELPDVRPHLWSLANALGMLISRFGPAFIDRIEAEAAASPAFRGCLAEVHPDPAFPIAESLWERLRAAGGTAIGPMSRRMAALHEDMPELATLRSWDPHPLTSGDAPSLGPAELRAQAEGWLVYHQSFWAWEELNRVLADEGWEAAWPLVLMLIAKGSDHAVCSVGAGILEDMLAGAGEAMIERVEAQAAADPRFRYCLSHVWERDMPPSLWARIVSARGDEPQRG
jgi:hypothetical protein